MCDARGPRDILYSGNMGAIAPSLRNRRQKGYGIGRKGKRRDNAH